MFLSKLEYINSLSTKIDTSSLISSDDTLELISFSILVLILTFFSYARASNEDAFRKWNNRVYPCGW